MNSDTEYITSGSGLLFCRTIGVGRPLVIVHGGPDFDHNYMVPETDCLADLGRMIYYDQRGRGRSAQGVVPEDVTVESEVEDLDAVRRRFRMDEVALIGHSWGGLIAMEYAIRNPGRVSRLILLNTAPASHADWLIFRQRVASERTVEDQQAMAAIRLSASYLEGEPDTEIEYYRRHFGVLDEEVVERVVGRLREHFVSEGVLLARAIEHRLYEQTWMDNKYNLLPKLNELEVPTLIIHGEKDLIPVGGATRIADTILTADLRILPGCGHFSFMEAPESVHELIGHFFSGDLSSNHERR